MGNVSLPGQKGRGGVQHISSTESNPMLNATTDLIDRYTYFFIVTVGNKNALTSGNGTNV